MKEMFRRLSARPLITAELLLASFFANLLALASPMFVIQVLNRYVAYGVDATLITLTAGVLAAIALELGFRQARVMIAASELEERDEDRAIGAFGVMVTAKTEALEQIPPGQRREILQGLTTLETTYNAPNMMAVMDVPFALIFVFALFMLNPVLGAISLAFIAIAVLFTIINQRMLQPVTQSLSQITGFGNSLVTTSNSAADTIRAFAGHELMMKAWRTYVGQAQRLRQLVSRRQGMSQTFTQSLQAVMGVAIIGIGAILVVGGDLDVGVMIGANILAARGLGPVIKLANLSESMSKAEQALAKIRGLAQLPVEEDAGSALGEYTGALELRDAAFAHQGSQTPLFEQLNLTLVPGSVLLIRGRNGAGKSTLARLLVGLMEPTRGQILADGVELRQLSPVWWRRQVTYLPQEPTFLNGTIRSNLEAVNPELDDEGLNEILRRAGLGPFIDESAKGFETEIIENGHTLAVGIRRRLALARAIATPGRLVVFDEPTEGVDQEGCAAVYEVMKTLAQDGRTIVVITSDPVILGGARLILDLNSKPVPEIINTADPDVQPLTSQAKRPS
jgi:ATP-binding cassette, subfamily C, bacterial LapB